VTVKETQVFVLYSVTFKVAVEPVIPDCNLFSVIQGVSEIDESTTVVNTIF
jgi:hypothetical protein